MIFLAPITQKGAKKSSETIYTLDAPIEPMPEKPVSITLITQHPKKAKCPSLEMCVQILLPEPRFFHFLF